MVKKSGTYKSLFWELIFQLTLLSVVFIFYCFDHHDSQVQEYEIAFFSNYAISSMIINFWLLPKVLYKKRYLTFALSLIVIMAVVILIEEGVIEKIYFPDTRGARFPGVFYNLLSALPTMTILVGGKFAWDALTQKRHLEQLEMLIKESELQYLKSQVNPHFLFNNLNNLYAYALESSAKTPEIILELSGILRYMLYECHEKYVDVSKEIEHLENFINLSKLQFEERGIVEFDVKGKNAEGKKIAPLILSVFAENAFKHSSSSMSSNIHIKISILINDQNQLIFHCENSFQKLTNTDQLAHGIGLSNVKKRLELLYPDNHLLEIETRNNLFRVKLILNL